MTTEEVAEVLHVDPATIRRLVNRGDHAAYRNGSFLSSRARCDQVSKKKQAGKKKGRKRQATESKRQLVEVDSQLL